MKIVGEKLNSSIAVIKEFIENRNTEEIVKIAISQKNAGADFIDINAGMFMEREPEMLAYMAHELVNQGLTLSIDSPSYIAIRAALKAANSSGNLINSVTLDKDRLENMTDLAREYNCSMVALCMQNSGMPENIDSRLQIADKLITYMTNKGCKMSDIYIDPMLRPLGADENSGLEALDAIKRIRNTFPECNIICGLSNLSFGMPKRKIINRAFAVAAICNGLNSAILDPLDRDLMGLISAAEAITGLDEFGIDYISKCRKGIIG